jgi:glycerol-3-phosphate dehydrogenase
VINAAGAWVDHVRKLEDPACEPVARLSKGVHLLLTAPSEWNAGLVVPVEDGRVTMALPWQGMLMLGTTDTDFEGPPDRCVVTAADAAQVLSEASIALPRETLRPENVRYSFAGLRVLPRGDGTTASAHREHVVRIGRFGMVSIAGGKLTTHRRIAVEALRWLPEPRLSDLRPAAVPLSQSRVAQDESSDWDVDPDVLGHVAGIYGRDAIEVLRKRRRYPNAMDRIHPRGPDIWAQVHHAVEREWAVTVEDVVRRRTTLAVRGLASDAVRAEIARVVGDYSRQTREAVFTV